MKYRSKVQGLRRTAQDARPRCKIKVYGIGYRVQSLRPEIEINYENAIRSKTNGYSENRY